MMPIRDRIRELRRVRAGDLVSNPRNWRVHSSFQRQALEGVLAEIGYADALLVRELPDGSLTLVDGHLRAETTPDLVVPVLVLDVSEDEADKLLATVDPLAALAEADNEKLTALLADIETESPALTRLFEQLASRPSEATEGPVDSKTGAESLREQFNILVTCADEAEQVALLERLIAEGLSCRAFIV